MTKLYDYWRLLRPLHWIKNVFAFIGLLFSEGYYDSSLIFKSILVFFAFSFVASTVYIINDIADLERDRIHPRKRKRALASGAVSVDAGWVVSAIMGTAGFLIGTLVSWEVLVILLVYVCINIAYSYALKNVVILDVFCISGGFMLRILSGTVGINIPPSQWLLLCGLMITLFLGFVKRRAEIVALRGLKNDHRKVLANYTLDFLDQIIGVCATAVILSYSLYTMSPETVKIHGTENLIYTVPFVIYALFRYLYLQHNENSGGNPTRDLLKDRHILFCVFGWTALTFAFFTF